MGRPGSSSDDLQSPPCGILGWGRRASKSESRRKLVFWWRESGTHMVGHGLCACWDTPHICNEAVKGVGLLHQIYDPRSGHVAAVSVPHSNRQSGSGSVKGTVTVWRDKCRGLMLESILQPVPLEEQDRKWQKENGLAPKPRIWWNSAMETGLGTAR